MTSQAGIRRNWQDSRVDNAAPACEMVVTMASNECDQQLILFEPRSVKEELVPDSRPQAALLRLGQGLWQAQRN